MFTLKVHSLPTSIKAGYSNAIKLHSQLRNQEESCNKQTIHKNEIEVFVYNFNIIAFL